MNYLMLVNKEHGLSESYVPKVLVDVDSKYKDGVKLEEQACLKWLELKSYVLEMGYVIDVESGYRSYDYQDKLLKKLIAAKGDDYAIDAIAIPGHSEHQTGLALDYCLYRAGCYVVEEEMYTCEECKKISDIAHKYGFIVRYPKGKEDITGYKYEPWHLRYVGLDLAEHLYVNKITLDEYYKEALNEEN